MRFLYADGEILKIALFIVGNNNLKGGGEKLKNPLVLAALMILEA